MGKLKRHVAIKLASESFFRYRRKEIDIAGLEQNLSTARSLLDGVVPKKLQETLMWAEGEVDVVQFMVPSEKQRESIDRVWRELEEEIARHDDSDDTDEA